MWFTVVLKTFISKEISFIEHKCLISERDEVKIEGKRELALLSVLSASSSEVTNDLREPW